MYLGVLWVMLPNLSHFWVPWALGSGCLGQVWSGGQVLPKVEQLSQVFIPNFNRRNYNEILHYDNDMIYCGHLNITYGLLFMSYMAMPNETCKMKTGEDEPLSTLFENLMMEYSFEMDHKMEES